ncbi:Uu.00g139640.m01.CDS01 [Anthostomella pinea]|uniref:Uu.00g139640.m01.CDS01 n=1 Tax=Anthostomella pinea TaxID=933095 RepID=A0AAI8VQV4_9PEZI|nr:Uu.00g139640.m01.CDS01 [Anthostomella pinea]
MPVTRTHCCLCGDFVIDENWSPSWMAQFYALYAVDEEADAPAFLSGPGRRQRFADVVQVADSERAAAEDDPSHRSHALGLRGQRGLPT